MKHLKMLLCILLALCTAIGLPGCGNGWQNAGSETGPPPISETEKSQTSEVMSEAADKPKDSVDGSVAGSNMIIAYFSWANNAEEYNLEDIGVDVLGHASVVVPGDVGRIAEYIEERTGAEMFPIILTEKYSSNYNECLEQAKDQRGQDEIPELSMGTIWSFRSRTSSTVWPGQWKQFIDICRIQIAFHNKWVA